jgi:hypothetical protein
LAALSGADYNSAFGSYALTTNESGDYNNAFGYHALYTNSGGAGNNAFGYNALANNQSGGYNTALGDQALKTYTGGDNNIAIGSNAGGTAAGTGSNNILIGNSVATSTSSTSNALNIGNVIYGVNMYNTSTGMIGIGVQAPTNTLHVYADKDPLKIEGLQQGASTDNILTVDATGVVKKASSTMSQQWFYLPSFNLDISSTGKHTIDLYNNVYMKQFGSGFIVSDGATLSTATNGQPLYTLGQLLFVVTDYDKTVLSGISIAGGFMTYNVLTTDAGPNSYINIICVVK